MDASYTIDVHTHPVPDFYREALIAAGYATREGNTLYVDGFRAPDFTIESYLENRAKYGYNFSVLSITAPGVTFLNGNSQARQLARRLNQQMFEWTQAHPQTLGAYVVLPLPDVEASIEEVRYGLDELHFDGVGLYSNYNGVYLGDPSLDPLFEELNRRKATVLVHPTAPVPEVKLKNISSPVIEYPYDTTRAITNLLFTQSRKRFPDIKMIFSHGGGVLPFLAVRLALQTTLPFHGGFDYDKSLNELKGYYYDLAVATSEPQLAALKSLVGVDKLLVGSDYPYLPERLIPQAQEGLASFSGFTPEDLKKIRHENSLSIFPTIKAKLQPLQPK